MSNGGVHISGIELHVVPGCQEGQERVFPRAVDVGMERAQRGVSCPLGTSQPEHAEDRAPLGWLAGSGGLGVRAQGACLQGWGPEWVSNTGVLHSGSLDGSQTKLLRVLRGAGEGAVGMPDITAQILATTVKLGK